MAPDSAVVLSCENAGRTSRLAAPRGAGGGSTSCKSYTSAPRIERTYSRAGVPCTRNARRFACSIFLIGQTSVQSVIRHSERCEPPLGKIATTKNTKDTKKTTLKFDELFELRDASQRWPLRSLIPACSSWSHDLASWSHDLAGGTWKAPGGNVCVFWLLATYTAV